MTQIKPKVDDRFFYAGTEFHILGIEDTEVRLTRTISLLREDGSGKYSDFVVNASWHLHLVTLVMNDQELYK